MLGLYKPSIKQNLKNPVQNPGIQHQPMIPVTGASGALEGVEGALLSGVHELVAAIHSVASNPHGMVLLALPVPHADPHSDGSFNAVGLDSFSPLSLWLFKLELVNKANWSCYCSGGVGKSTLMNHLFRTSFREMDAFCRRLVSSTKGLIGLTKTQPQLLRPRTLAGTGCGCCFPVIS